jgi:hypothetical protein
MAFKVINMDATSRLFNYLGLDELEIKESLDELSTYKELGTRVRDPSHHR